MHRKHIELILMALFFAACLWLSSTAQAAPAAKQPVPAKSAKPALQGFKVWKSNRVQMARQAISDFRSQNQNIKESETPAQEDPNQKTGNPSVQAISVGAEDDTAPAKKEEKKQATNHGEALRQLEFNLEIALGLTIHDYFALYIKDKSPEDLQQIVKLLSPNELSELLLAYRQQLFEPPKALQNAEVDAGEKTIVK